MDGESQRVTREIVYGFHRSDKKQTHCDLCSYDERELYEMLRGFQEDFPDGGIYRFQFESFFPDMKAGKNMGDMVFRCENLFGEYCTWTIISSVLDADHNGFLDFKEFQQAIDLVGARLPDDRLRWSFRLYDMDNSGSIALNEMEGVFDCIYNMFEVL